MCLIHVVRLVETTAVGSPQFSPTTAYVCHVQTPKCESLYQNEEQSTPSTIDTAEESTGASELIQTSPTEPSITCPARLDFSDENETIDNNDDIRRPSVTVDDNSLITEALYSDNSSNYWESFRNPTYSSVRRLSRLSQLRATTTACLTSSVDPFEDIMKRLREVVDTDVIGYQYNQHSNLNASSSFTYGGFGNTIIVDGRNDLVQQEAVLSDCTCHRW
jgi:hypothetical protein